MPDMTARYPEKLDHPEMRCDVLVAGGGPAGSTIAALLAERGYHVVLLEKARHPRFHIGESLLPLNLPLLDRLGVADEVARIGMLKYGAEFISPYHNKAVTFQFGDAWDKAYPYAYQVRRSEFDHILLKNAAAKGATVIEGSKVRDIEFLADGGSIAEAEDEAGERRSWHAKFFVDATGRDTLLASRFGTKRRNPKHASAAVYGHFTGAERQTGKDEGNISIFWFDHGWIWYIPLADGTTSVGAVCWPHYLKSRKTDMTTFFRETIAQAPALAERLKHAELQGSAIGTGNYSYRADRMAGAGYLMLGDAFAFIDPVFSTGVYLAMNSAFVGADVIETCLRDPAKAAQALRGFDARIRGGLKTFSWYIYRLTTPVLRNLIMDPSNVFRVEEALLSLLAGDVFRPSPIFARLVIFKLIYYSKTVRSWRESFAAWRRRRDNIRVIEGEAP
ncbi:MAG TPA: NAD(P)/FAD-dependent oxidoreductase [Stellaceae bacterium]|nr:NAD(P)/FAD-dependent oxidoreductase [Stellaceae bacterium]